VAQSLAERASAQSGVRLITASRPALDLADPPSVERAIREARPDIVVSAAAYTAVDRAEEEPEVARAVNETGAAVVAAAAAAVGAPVIHLSTDYVFSGAGESPWRETDLPDPQSVYGRTKLAGEAAVADANPDHVILRTSWVYSPFGKNFVRTMLTVADNQDQVRVVSDQRGSPTSALDIADGIMTIACRLLAAPSPACWGVFHLSGSGSTDWATFAQEVFSASWALGGPSATVERITTAEYPSRAPRPRNSVLSCQKLLDTYGWQAPRWQRSCRATVARLLSEEPRGSRQA
jgi:dTDP-4-dehydrorhamnose reductase